MGERVGGVSGVGVEQEDWGDSLFPIPYSLFPHSLLHLNIGQHYDIFGLVLKHFEQLLLD